MYNGTLYNCISWSNNVADSQVTAYYSRCVGYTNDDAVGNIANDPRFVSNGSGYGTNHVAGNYRLASGSPCVNTGTNQAWMTNSVDLDGRARIRYGRVDMGAYELIYHGTIVTIY